MDAGTGTGRGRAAVLVRIDREWAALQDDDVAATACRRWAARHAVLAGCARPEDVRARVAGAPDEVLLALLEASTAGDPLAGRVVLQALLPKVVLMASVDPAAEVDDYLAALCCEIAAYPWTRRRRSVAANLALDTLKAVHRARRPAPDVVVPPHLVVVAADHRPGHVLGASPIETQAGPSAEGVLRRAREAHLVDPSTRALLRSVYAEGLSSADAGRRHGLSVGAVRSRCSRAVRLLARHPELLAEAS